jgi:hypothetical protein
MMTAQTTRFPTLSTGPLTSCENLKLLDHLRDAINLRASQRTRVLIITGLLTLVLSLLAVSIGKSWFAAAVSLLFLMPVLRFPLPLILGVFCAVLTSELLYTLPTVTRLSNDLMLMRAGCAFSVFVIITLILEKLSSFLSSKDSISVLSRSAPLEILRERLSELQSLLSEDEHREFMQFSAQYTRLREYSESLQVQAREPQKYELRLFRDYAATVPEEFSSATSVLRSSFSDTIAADLQSRSVA